MLKARAIEEQLGVRSDGSPVPLTFIEWLRYGSPRSKLEAIISNARDQEDEILSALDELGEIEVLSMDTALTQFFILEQFSLFKRYALSTQFFTFATFTALPVAS